MDTRDFIKQIIDNQKVYLLTSEEGFATSLSEEFEYEDGSNLEVICFWSSEDKAQEARKNQWENHKTESLDFNVFLEEWLFGMIEEVALAGLNFNADLQGEEISPIDFILEIVHYVRTNGIDYKPLLAKNIAEIRSAALDIKESLN
ncbi:DUF2750 domain-containing protein [Faecalibacter rhinopitheci]|uniref:DUF2750 domain-containing protein n=1 Tax=Faecalibacter rhinopitheci TaxID=2779678 RepID=A0A8J7FPT7_9FLAO|nr:DUF2750 domain-containing protein [Faecalibacter rhinopitheci]MBF0597239.1 DUF2750 domain-containing protein [Faecalibacter rhinopitheci]MBQ0147349.1 DUF2750 domain-containing protein [Candidatus Onthonaster equi]